MFTENGPHESRMAEYLLFATFLGRVVNIMKLESIAGVEECTKGEYRGNRKFRIQCIPDSMKSLTGNNYGHLTKDWEKQRLRFYVELFIDPSDGSILTGGRIRKVLEKPNGISYETDPTEEELSMVESILLGIMKET